MARTHPVLDARWHYAEFTPPQDDAPIIFLIGNLRRSVNKVAVFFPNWKTAVSRGNRAAGARCFRLVRQRGGDARRPKPACGKRLGGYERVVAYTKVIWTQK